MHVEHAATKAAVEPFNEAVLHGFARLDKVELDTAGVRVTAATGETGRLAEAGASMSDLDRYFDAEACCHRPHALSRRIGLSAIVLTSPCSDIIENVGEIGAGGLRNHASQTLSTSMFS